MKSIRTSDLRDGMKFDKPVYMEGENIFVPPGVPIRQKDIERLLRWEIAEVRTDGSPVVDAPKAVDASLDLASFRDMPASDRDNLDSYLRAIDEYEHIATSVAQGEEIDRAKIDSTVNLLLEKVKDRRNEMIQLILMGGRIERKIAAGVINVTILSAIMGTVLKFTSHRLIQLTTGALLHDTGMVKVPKAILQKKDKLSPEELNQIRTHPIHSYRVISKELKYPEEIAIIALQHHERWDGQGYPRKLRGEDINLSARIVAVADSYIAMINNRPHRNSMIGYSAMKSLLNDNGRHFDPKILKVFLESMGIYPIGSIVQLNNSGIGRVIETHAEAPLRPAVELIIDEYGNKLGEREVVDLLVKKGIFIVKAVDPKSLAPASPSGAPPAGAMPASPGATPMSPGATGTAAQ
ncbi:MAG: HD-GYP domain-containing protein [Spirochaetia bacterium]|jgi:HD-GYP domain-containing protein (c-di-GMP phosphodiesterase class II)